MKNGDLQLVAASLSFSTIIALIPFLAVTLAVFKSNGGLEILYPKVEALIVTTFKETAGGEASRILKKILVRISNIDSLGKLGASVLFLTTFRLVIDVENGLNRIWGIKKSRAFLKRIPFILGFYFLFPLGLAMYAGFKSLSFMRPVFKTDYENIFEFFMGTLALFFLYKILPNIKVKASVCTVAAGIASCFLILLENSFAHITRNFFNYSKIYGSIAAFPLLCLFILIVWQIILGGAALSASLQKRTLD